jgi:hypothetical protein
VVLPATPAVSLHPLHRLFPRCPCGFQIGECLHQIAAVRLDLVGSHTLISEQIEALDALPNLTVASEQTARKPVPRPGGQESESGGHFVEIVYQLIRLQEQEYRGQAVPDGEELDGDRPVEQHRPALAHGGAAGP